MARNARRLARVLAYRGMVVQVDIHCSRAHAKLRKSPTFKLGDATGRAIEPRRTGATTEGVQAS